MACRERSVPAADGFDFMSRCLRATCVNNTPFKGPCNRDDGSGLGCVFSVFCCISWMDLPLLVGSADVLEFAFLLFCFQPKFCRIGCVSEAISSPQSRDFITETLRVAENDLLHSSIHPLQTANLAVYTASLARLPSGSCDHVILADITAGLSSYVCFPALCLHSSSQFSRQSLLAASPRHRSSLRELIYQTGSPSQCQGKWRRSTHRGAANKSPIV